MLKPTIFREYDIRGVADIDLPSEGIEGLGRALGTYLRRNAGTNLTLGRDVRLSGPRLHDALLKGLLSAGCDVTLLGTVPTPLLYYSVDHLGADGGVMLTGSHNPPEYNGFKTVCGQGTIHGAAIQEVYRILSQGDFETGAGKVSEAAILPPYVREVSKQFRFARRIKVVVDCGNGVAGPATRQLLNKLDVDVVELFFEPDGRFPNHHPDPTVEANLEPLKKAVAEHRAAFGIAFDGDGDRIGAVDEHGTVVWGDQLMLIFGREILTRKPGATFIGEVKCSQVMYDELKRLGGRPIMYKTGHSLIKAKMKEEHAELAGEMSGHMFFADRYYGFDDALYAACRLIEIVAASGKRLSAQLLGLPKMVVTPELRFDCSDEAKFAVVDRVKEYFKGKREVIDVDGARVLFEKGWGLVRASNTQPVLVLRFEAETQELLQQYRDEVEAAVRASL
jgi:phosphomannomutase / phosphoglucomutase